MSAPGTSGAAGSAIGPEPGPVPLQERILALDVARGIAVLGVLLMNVWAFAGPQAYFDYPVAIADRGGAPVATWVVIHTLFEGSQRTLLSLLFGAGALLLMTRLEKDSPPGTARGTWYRRTFVLIGFGLVNAYVFLWPADILFCYGLAGLCLYPLRKLRTPVLLAIVLAALAVPAVRHGLAIGKLTTLEATSMEAVARRDRGETLDGPYQQAIDDWDKKLKKARPDPADPELAREISTMQSGTLPEIAWRQAKVSLLLETVVTANAWFLDALAMMILGMVLCRSGFLTRPVPRSRYAALCAAGFLIGMPLALWQTSVLLTSDFHPIDAEVTKVTYDLRRLAMGLGYLGLIFWFCQAAGGVAVRRALSATGRMALTNYLAQSILCALIFYGFGLGLYGRVTGYQLYGVVALIWALELAWSSWWLARFRLGPAEWVWRSLTYQRRLGAKQELLHPVPEQGSTL